MCRVIAVSNQKGGVGKTVSCVNLGIGLAQEGKKVLLVDADPQGSLTISLGYEEPDEMEYSLATLMMNIVNDEKLNMDKTILHHKEGVDLIPANIELSAIEVSLVNAMSRELILRSMIDKLREFYDYIIIDCMPSLGMMTINALACADSVLIPVQAAYLPVKGLQQLIKTIGRVKKQLNPKLKIEGILLTMVDNRTNYASRMDAYSIFEDNIQNIFVMMEQYDEGSTGELNVNQIFKYTSIKEIFNEIIGKSTGALNIAAVEKKETQIILVTSAAGGVGKTTVAMGVAACLAQNYKRVLYINAAHLQAYHHMLDNHSVIATSDVYTRLATSTQDVYAELKHVIRKETFSYLPPFKASLMSLGLNYSVYEKIIMSAKKSGDYNFIIVDADTTFDEDKAALLNHADKVLIITKQTLASVLATNL